MKEATQDLAGGWDGLRVYQAVCRGGIVLCLLFLIAVIILLTQPLGKHVPDDYLAFRVLDGIHEIEKSCLSSGTGLITDPDELARRLGSRVTFHGQTYRGYRFEFGADASSATWSARANPAIPDSAHRFLFIDQTGVIRAAYGSPATSRSQPFPPDEYSFAAGYSSR